MTTVACHHTLTELLLFLGSKANQVEPFKRMAGVMLSVKDIADIHRLNHCFVTQTTPETVGVSLTGDSDPTPTSKALRNQGLSWSLHVLEGPYSWCLSAVYITGTVVAGCPPFVSIKSAIWGVGSDEEGATEEERLAKQLSYAALVLDSIIYCFCPLVFSLILRVLQRRQLLARCDPTRERTAAG